MKAAYDEILDRGAINAYHEFFLIQGRVLFGPAVPETEIAVRAIFDIQRLKRMVLVILKAKSWDELLQTP